MRVQFRILSGKRAGTIQEIARLPLMIGRHASAGLCLEEAGVWDEHLRLELKPREGLMVTVLSEALAMLNGQPLKSAFVRNGDILQLGSAKLQFWLSPTRQRSFQWCEVALWIAFAALCAGQLLLIDQLLR